MDFWKEFNHSCATLFAALFGGTVALIIFSIIASIVILVLCVLSILIFDEIANDLQSALLTVRGLL